MSWESYWMRQLSQLLIFLPNRRRESRRLKREPSLAVQFQFESSDEVNLIEQDFVSRAELHFFLKKVLTFESINWRGQA